MKHKFVGDDLNILPTERRGELADIPAIDLAAKEQRPGVWFRCVIEVNAITTPKDSDLGFDHFEGLHARSTIKFRSGTWGRKRLMNITDYE